MDEKEATCCFTGHRVIPASQRPALEKRLEAEIVDLIRQGVRYFGAGGARGFDTMAAQAVLRLRAEHPHIRLHLVLPCKAQAINWSEGDKATYNHVLGQADQVVYTAKLYERGCMEKRSRHLVESSAVCLCYLTNRRGGTAYTVEYAQLQGLRIVHLA